MTTPTERLVLEAALRWREDYVSTAHREELATAELFGAVGLLAAERAAGHTEQELTFGQLVADDLIQSANGRWYTVDRMVATPGQSDVKVWLQGVPKPLEKFSGQTVQVRRSGMGKAVDVFASVIWSGTAGGSVRAA